MKCHAVRLVFVKGLGYGRWIAMPCVRKWFHVLHRDESRQEWRGRIGN